MVLFAGWHAGFRSVPAPWMESSRLSRRKTTGGLPSAFSGTRLRPALRAWTSNCFAGSSRLVDSKAWARSAQRACRLPNALLASLRVKHQNVQVFLIYSDQGGSLDGLSNGVEVAGLACRG